MKGEQPQPPAPKTSAILWLYGRTLLLIVLTPILPVLLRFLLEAAIWRYVLAALAGIVFVGNFGEALALSLTIQVIITFIDLSVKTAAQATAKFKKTAPLPVSASESLPVEERLALLAKCDWRSTVRLLIWRFLCTASVLAALARLFPTHLAFATPVYLLGTTLLLTVVYYSAACIFARITAADAGRSEETQVD